MGWLRPRRIGTGWPVLNQSRNLELLLGLNRLKEVDDTGQPSITAAGRRSLACTGGTLRTTVSRRNVPAHLLGHKHRGVRPLDGIGHAATGSARGGAQAGSSPDTDPDQAAAFHAVRYLVDSARRRLMAKDVETADQVASAPSLGCAAGQGYQCSVAVPARDMTDLLRCGVIPTARRVPGASR